MNEYLFGCGEGWLPKRAASIAKSFGATLVNHSDPQCKCGRGCATDECKASRRHWFAIENNGEPFNSKISSAVIKALS